MKLHIFGSCSGTEPIESFCHTAFAIEINDDIYWFDAGEGCARTAHLEGVDLLKIKSIFISHPHLDHTGGLCNLLWTVKKLSKRQKRKPRYEKISTYLPSEKIWTGVWNLLKANDEDFENVFSVAYNPVKEGLLYKDGNTEVFALANNHMENVGGNEKVSYSYKIKAEGKTIIFSGDVKTPCDLDEFFTEKCDCLMIETGHHKIADVCAYANEKKVGNLMFMHHGREVLQNINQARLYAQSISESNVVFCEDMSTFEI